MSFDASNTIPLLLTRRTSLPFGSDVPRPAARDDDGAPDQARAPRRRVSQAQSAWAARPQLTRRHSAPTLGDNPLERPPPLRVTAQEEVDARELWYTSRQQLPPSRVRLPRVAPDCPRDPSLGDTHGADTRDGYTRKPGGGYWRVHAQEQGTSYVPPRRPAFAWR